MGISCPFRVSTPSTGGLRLRYLDCQSTRRAIQCTGYKVHTHSSIILFQTLQHYQQLRACRLPSRRFMTATQESSSDAPIADKTLPPFSGRSNRKTEQAKRGQPLARLPTSSVWRSLFLGAFFSSPILFTPGFTLLKKISTSPSYLWNPDKNPVLRAIVKPLVYDQFCAGTNPSETRAKISQIRNFGFSGVILSYGREGQIQESHSGSDITDAGASCGDQDLELWKRGNLETLDMITTGDYLGIKYVMSCERQTPKGLLIAFNQDDRMRQIHYQ